MTVGLATRGLVGNSLATRGYAGPPAVTPPPPPDELRRGRLALIGSRLASIALVGSRRATVALVGVRSATIELVGEVMISIAGPFEFFRGSSARWRITVTNDVGAPINITGTGLELQVKRRPGDADPPRISKSVGSGITILAQTGDTLGQADCVFDPSDTSDRESMPAGTYHVDVVSIVSGDRQYVVKPDRWILRDVVNDA